LWGDESSEGGNDNERYRHNFFCGDNHSHSRGNHIVGNNTPGIYGFFARNGGSRRDPRQDGEDRRKYEGGFAIMIAVVFCILFAAILTSLAFSGWILVRLLELELDAVNRSLEKYIKERETKKFTIILDNVKKTDS
jgi:hypothetical protein